jgi:hypothetical protein
MCKRSANDPLIQLFVSRYGLNLLTVPREASDVGDLYVADGGGVSAPGSVTALFEPALTLPPVARGEAMADVTGAISASVSAEAGLGLLGRFLSAFGAAGMGDAIAARFAAARATTLRFSLADATRDSIDPLVLGTRLLRSRLVEDHPMVGPDRRYYLVTAVARSSSIRIAAGQSASASAGIDIDIGGLGGDGKVAVDRSGDGAITFRSNKRLAFGVQLHELSIDQRDHKLKLKTTGAVAMLRGAEPQRPLIEPTLLGGPDGEAFVEL